MLIVYTYPVNSGFGTSRKKVITTLFKNNVRGDVIKFIITDAA